MKKEVLIQSVPNYSEGRDLKKIEQILEAFRGIEGVKLLDYSTDPDHNRCVVTVVGQPEPLGRSLLDATGRAVSLINMNRHEGQHPRIGAADIIPFIPFRNCGIEEADRLARSVAQEAAERFDLPCYLYGKSAAAPYREDVSDIRRGQFEGLAKKLRDPLWKPDFGPDKPHPTAGASIIGARMPMICFNIILNTTNVELAQNIARRVRQKSGGLRYVKAMGIAHEERNLSQVTMNLTDYTQSSLYSVYEMVKMEARRYGLQVVGSEVAGFIPVQALLDSAEYYLQIENFSPDQVLELHF